MSTTELTRDYFADPLTTATFDRTENQRAERTAIVNGLREEGVDDRDVETLANKTMFGVFATHLSQLIDEKCLAKIGQAVDTNPSVDPNALRTLAGLEIAKDLKALHDEIPLPNLEGINQ